MKEIAIIFVSLFIVIFSVHGQKIKNLNVFVTDFFDVRSSITGESLNNDPLLVADALKNALVINSFRVISERVAREKTELNNRGQVTDTTYNQDISIGTTTYINSVYVVTLKYQYRSDTGCGGSVMSNLSGQVIDLANDGQIVATFSFKQGSFGGKCTEDVMNALASTLKKQSKNK